MRISDSIKKAIKWIRTDHRAEMYKEWDLAFVEAINRENKRRDDYNERLKTLSHEELLQEIAYNSKFKY